MGEMADYLINGDDCEQCGEYIGPGYGVPRKCAGCGGEAQTFENRVLDMEMNELFIELVDTVRQYLKILNARLIKERPIDFGWQFKTIQGTVINLYTSGNYIPGETR